MKNIKVVKVIFSGFGAAGTIFLLQVFLSHQLTIQEFGVYSAATSFLTIIGPMASIGIANLFLRKVCVDALKTDHYLGLAFKCLLITFLISAVVSLFIFSKAGLTNFESICLVTYYLPLSSQYLIIAFEQAKENFSRVSIAQVLLPIIRMVVILFSLLTIINLTSISLILAISHIIALAFLVFLARDDFGFKYFIRKADWADILKFLKESIYYSLNGSINVAQIQISTVVAIFLFGSSGSALYAPATTILTACYILPNMIFGTYLLPKYHKMNSDAAANKVILINSALSFASGLVFAVILVFSGHFIIQFVYPKSYIPSAHLLNILCISLPFRFFSTALGTALLTEYCIKHKVIASFLSIVLQIIFMFAMYRYGVASLAISFVFSEIITAFLYYYIFVKNEKRLKTQLIS